MAGPEVLILFVRLVAGAANHNGLLSKCTASCIQRCKAGCRVSCPDASVGISAFALEHGKSPTPNMQRLSPVYPFAAALPSLAAPSGFDLPVIEIEPFLWLWGHHQLQQAALLAAEAPICYTSTANC